LNKFGERTPLSPKVDFYGKHFFASRGVRQGNIMSPTILCGECSQYVYRQSLIDVLFYANYGMIAGEGSKELQYLLDLCTENCAAVGLKMNAEKVESMIMEGGEIPKPWSKDSYHCRVTGIGKCREKDQERYQYQMK
jgi:hypothetical protein